MLRFAIKAGIAAGAVYYVRKEGVWEHSQESLKVYDKLATNLQPLVTEARKQIPFELPKIPDHDNAAHTVKLYWNKGVVTTFQFLADFPDLITTWTSDGITAILENPDVRKVLDLETPNSIESAAKQ